MAKAHFSFSDSSLYCRIKSCIFSGEKTVYWLSSYETVVEWILMGLEDQVWEALDFWGVLALLIVGLALVASLYPGKLNPQLANGNWEFTIFFHRNHQFVKLTSQKEKKKQFIQIV